MDTTYMRNRFLLAGVAILAGAAWVGTHVEERLAGVCGFDPDDLIFQVGCLREGADLDE